MGKELNRFTTIPFVIEMLKQKQLTLLNPFSWEDKNDIVTLKKYLEKTGAKSIYVLCMLEGGETVHHWNAFANENGCCIEFNRTKLLEVVERNSCLHRKVEYVKLEDLDSKKDDTDNLPFLKRYPYRVEEEFRIVKIDNNDQKQTFNIPIDLDVIQKITITNKLPKSTYESIEEELKRLAPAPAPGVIINHSSLYENEKWISTFKNT